MDNAIVEPQRNPWKTVFWNIGFVALALGVAYWLTVSVGIDRLRDLAASTGIAGALAIIALKMTTLIVVPLGGGPIYPIAGAAFGFWKGFALTFVGDTLGFTVAFFLSRYWGRPIVNFFVPSVHTKRLEEILARSGELGAFIKARIAFIGFPEVFAYAAGLTSVSFPIFIIAMMAIHGPTSALLVVFGDVLLSGNLTYLAIASVISVGLAVIGGWWFHKDLVREN